MFNVMEKIKSCRFTRFQIAFTIAIVQLTLFISIYFLLKRVYDFSSFSFYVFGGIADIVFLKFFTGPKFKEKLKKFEKQGQ